MTDKIDTSPAAIAALCELISCNLEWDGLDGTDRDAFEQTKEMLPALAEERDRLKAVVDGVRNNIPMSYLERHGMQNIVEAMRDYAEQRWAEKERIRDLTAERDRLVAQLAEARAEGWRKGIKAAATVNAGEAREILDHAAPASAVNALRWAEKRIRALPVPADLGVRHE